jgi:hypothetical protein
VELSFFLSSFGSFAPIKSSYGNHGIQVMAGELMQNMHHQPVPQFAVYTVGGMMTVSCYSPFPRISKAAVVHCMDHLEKRLREAVETQRTVQVPAVPQAEPEELSGPA